MNSSKWTSRKFTLVCVSQLLFVLLLWFGKINEGVFESLTMVILSGYAIANVSQRVLVKDS